MDGPTRRIVSFVCSTESDFEALSTECVHAVVRNYVDSVACAAAGFDSEPTAVARRIAATAKGSPCASVFGESEGALIEFAVFANALATRYADFNDVFIPALHPSDMNPALMAMAEARGMDGRDLVSAMYVAYQVAGKIGACPVVPLRDSGWDHGVWASIGTAAGLAKLLHLSEEQVANAVAMAITPSVPLRIARAGELSHWKAAAVPHSTMTATFATRLAQAGMTGPAHVFDGVEALFEKVTGPFDLGAISPAAGEPTVAERTQHKYSPGSVETQTPARLVMNLGQHFRPQDVESIEVATFYLAWHEAGGGQGDGAEKWDPRTPETADHSIPYIMAVALVDGELSRQSFDLDRIRDRDLRPLMQRISVTHNPEYSERHASRGEQPTAVRVTLKDGRVLTDEEWHPRGHPDNPMTDEELRVKFDTLVRKVLPPAQREELRDRLWGLPAESNLDGITRLFRSFGR